MVGAPVVDPSSAVHVPRSEFILEEELVVHGHFFVAGAAIGRASTDLEVVEVVVLVLQHIVGPAAVKR
jgi:hypothetical protein